MTVRRLLIDNSSLSVVLGSSSRTKEFGDHLSKSGVTCYVSQYTLQELLGNEDVDARTAQLEELANLVRRLPPSQMRLAADYTDAIQQEMQQPLTEPALAKTDYLQMLRDPNMVPVVAPDIGSHTSQAAGVLFNKDRGLRWKLHAEVGEPSDSELAAAILNPAALTADFMSFEWAAARSAGRWTAQKIFDQPARFPTIHAFSHLLFRQAYASLATPNCKIELIGAFRTKKNGGRGNWGDARVCALAVSADLFVADDHDLRRRASLLKHAGIVKFSSCTLADLLAAAEPTG